MKKSVTTLLSAAILLTIFTGFNPQSILQEGDILIGDLSIPPECTGNGTEVAVGLTVGVRMISPLNGTNEVTDIISSAVTNEDGEFFFSDDEVGDLIDFELTDPNALIRLEILTEGFSISDHDFQSITDFFDNLEYSLLISPANLEWVAHHGFLPDPSATVDTVKFRAVTALDVNKNIYVTGFMNSVPGTSPSNASFVTIKYRPNGDTAWVREFDAGVLGTGAVPLAIVVEDPDCDVYVSGFVSPAFGRSVMLTLRYDSLGNLLNSQVFDSGFGVNQPNDIEIGPAGNIYITGVSETAATGRDFITVKYAPNLGPQLWFSRFNGIANGSDESNALALFGNSVYVTGSSAGAVSSRGFTTIKYNATTGAQVWVQQYEGSANLADAAIGLDLDGIGNVYITGSSQETGQGFNITTIKYAPNGAQLWVQSHHTAGSDFDAAQGIAVSDAGEVYVIGSNGTGINILPTGAVQVNQTLLDFDFTTIKYSTGGFQQWVRTFDGTIDGDLDVPHDLVLDDQGNVFIAGVSQGPSAFDTGLNFGFGVTGNFTNIIQGAGTGITVFIPELPVSIGSGPGDNGTTLKYDASGDLIFAEIFDTPEGAQDGFFGIDLDDDGNVYASGFSAILDANNNFGVKFTTVKYTECKEIPEISVLIDGSDNTPTVRDTVSNTFDRFGNIFLPEELRLISSTHGGGHCVAGIFAVDFFGPEFSTDPNAQDMRNVVCQVFGDISALLVNSQCNNVDPVVQIEIHSDRDLRGALATASSRYTTCGVTDRNGILYGNVWKAINTGVNGPEYDGSINVRFDPQTVLTGSFWNFDPRNATTGALEFDLYTVILHEILHLLGFNTFISNNGTSSISTTFGDFYSKYDTYLEDGNSNPLIVITDGCYNAVFNPSANVSDLTAGCGQINYNGPIGGFNPVHAPATFRLGTSISHFDIPCVGPPPFYVMDPFIPTTFDLRRVLTVEEVGVLCDLGYQTTGNFGDASGFFGSLVGNHTVGGLPSCGQIVAGTNDGFPNTCAQSRYVVPGCVGSTITIPILDNDPGATSYRCLEILTGEGTILSQGMTSFVFRVDPLKPCIVTLRYIPENGNISGNTTCVSIEVTPCGNTTCATATNCNQVCNPDFTDPTDCSVAPSAGACQNNPFVLCAVPNWIRSHGTPQISTIGNPTAATMWALHDNIVVGSRGEGIITKFVACTTGTRYIFTYIRRATFGVTTDNIRAVFAIQGTSGLPLPSTTETSTPPRPLLDEQEVVHETNVAVNPLFEQVTVCFTANDNYDMLWIYPEQNPGNNQAFMDVDFVGVIEDVFSAGPDQVINCGVTTIGLPTTCELRGMGFQWTVLSGDLQSISRVIGTDPTQTVIQVEPTVTTTYKLTRTFVPNPSSVVIGNQAGCVLMDQVTVTVTNPVDASFILSNNTSCANAADGVAGVLPSGGTPPYTFQWSTVPIQTGASATGLTAGTYFVTVTDAAGCRGFGAVTITEPTTNITATFTTTDVSCIGADDGSINLTPVTSVPPLSFVWSNGLNTEDISGLTPGTYTVRINDATPSCFIIEDITIGILPPIVITEDNVAGACSQGTLGSIDITVSGGTPPFGFIWSDLNTTEDRTGLTADTYTVTVTDVNGCTAEETFIVPELTSPRINAIRVGDGFCPPSNFQQGLLALILGQNDGTPPFTFLWSDGQITKNPVGLTSGTYTVTVTDANGCTTVGEHTLTNAVDLDIQIAADITDLCAVPGTLSVTSSFPDPMRFYQWFLNGDEIAGATDPTFIITDPNATGGYHLRVITFDGCEKITDVILLKCAPTEPDFTLDIQGTLIAGITSCKSSEFTSANCKSCALKRYTVTFCNIGQNAVETCDLVINIDPKSEFREFQEIRFIPIGGEPSEPGVSNGEKTITIPNVLCDMRCGVVVFDVEIPISVPDCIGASVPLDLSVDYFDSGIGSNQETEHLDHTQTYDGPDDPNNKLIVFPEPVACPFVDKDDTVVFQINFQNEGFAPARDVILVDTIDISALDISTFDILHASHTAQFSLSPGGVLTIHYLNINLPDIGSDPEGSIGFAKFSFMPLSSVTAGTVFENKAAIFFDFNPPVITNTVSRTIVDERTVTVDAGIDQTIFIGFGDTCVTLTATPSGALPPYIFEWSNGETTQSIEVCSEEAGTFSVIADASGCVSQPDSVTVEVIDVRCGNKNDRVLVCHVPSGNSGNEHEICVNPNAVAAHLAHGDRLGPCDRPVGKKGDSSDKNEGLEQINQISLSEPLLEAYPNPFSNTTTIRFSVPKTEKVQISVYNLAGEQIEVLFDRVADKDKEYDLEFEAKDLPNGVYLYRLITESNVRTKKLIILW